MVYNYTQLTQGSNIVEWLVIFNSMSNGIIFSGIALSIVLIIFGVMKLQNIDTDDALIASGFIGFIITALFWLIQFNGQGLVPTIIPFGILLLTGSAFFMKMIRDWV